MFEEENRIISSMRQDGDEIENVLRPKRLEDYIGQEKVKSNLRVFMETAKSRGEALDHVLLYGPPGLGKTTLSHILAAEMDADLRVTSGPAIEHSGDLLAILTNLTENSVLFIDEIHRLNHTVEEMLYPALEDFAVDMIFGKGPAARTVHIPLQHFTLVGATTKAGMLSAPLRDRFGVVCRLELYEPSELSVIVKRSARLLGIPIAEEAALEIASRSRGTPRIANRFLKRVRDFAEYEKTNGIDLKITKHALKNLEVDELGLDKIDKLVLNTIIGKFAGGPVGLDTLAATTGEDANTIEDVYEPYLMQLGFLMRTPRGRIATERAYEHLGFDFPNKNGKEG